MNGSVGGERREWALYVCPVCGDASLYPDHPGGGWCVGVQNFRPTHVRRHREPLVVVPKAELDEWEQRAGRVIADYNAETQLRWKAERERDEALAENERLREALERIAACDYALNRPAVPMADGAAMIAKAALVSRPAAGQETGK